MRLKQAILKTTLLAFMIACTQGVELRAALRLPSLVSDGMVLQQNSTLLIWGWAVPGQTIRIQTSWNGESKPAETHADASGNWKGEIQTPEAGGPHRISISTTDETLTVSDILTGEVWLCSGQSNMEMPLKGFRSQPVYGCQEALLQAPDPKLRLFTVERQRSETDSLDCSGSWKSANASTIYGFSAVGYFYGKRLRETLGVPVGIIEATWGGTPIETWIDSDTISTFAPSDLMPQDEDRPHRNPSALFHGMIAPVTNMSIRGVLWYQGEGNRTNPEPYARLFPGLINGWRQAWQRPDLPFYFVQIAPYEEQSPDVPKDLLRSVYIREAQLHTMQTTPRTGMAVTLDIGSRRVIHPPEKKTVGDRLAYWALRDTYGMAQLSASGPIYDHMTVEGNLATIHFTGLKRGLRGLNSELSYFTISGPDKVFHRAKAVATVNGEVIVSSDLVQNPVAVRYAWSDWTGASLFDSAGLPASSFRTDDWSD